MTEQFILTNEELSFSLALCGYDEIASGMMHENLGEVSEESWELVLQTAARSLYSKGILLELDDQDVNHSFIGGFREIIDDLAESKHIIRCYTETNNGPFILTLHRGKNGLVFHLIINEFVHVLKYINSEKLLTEITDFYNPKFVKDSPNLSFSLSESEFESFVEHLQNNRDITEFINLNPTLKRNLFSAKAYAIDFKKKEGNLANLALIETEDSKVPTLLEIFLLLPVEDRTWVIYSSNPDENNESKLFIEILQEE